MLWLGTLYSASFIISINTSSFGLSYDSIDFELLNSSFWISILIISCTELFEELLDELEELDSLFSDIFSSIAARGSTGVLATVKEFSFIEVSATTEVSEISELEAS